MNARRTHGRGRARGRREAGLTLIELVISIVVIGIAVSGVLSVMSLTTAHSTDPMLQVQAEAVAQSYLEEILLRSYTDPDGAGGENRATFDDVDDYNGLAANGCLTTSAACPALGDCACDQFGAPIDALAGYAVSVAVNADTLNGAPAKRVDVTVTRAGSPAVRARLSGYRAGY